MLFSGERIPHGHPPKVRPAISAFTLLELLTVITIIAILMGLLFPVYAKIQDRARAAEARAVVTEVATAIRGYVSENGRYPVGDYAVNGDLKVGDKANGTATDDNDQLFNILRARLGPGNLDNAGNRARVVYMGSKIVGNTSVPKSGFLEASGSGKVGALYDPWGKQYVVIMDTNYNNVINLQGIYSDFTQQSQGSPSDIGAQTDVGAISLGTDGQLGSPKDGLTGRLREGNKISDDATSFQ